MPQEVRLRDGTAAWVLSLMPTDKATLAAEYETLSPETKRARFLAPVMHLSDSMLHHLVDGVDGVDHVALVLSAETSPGVFDPVALARMVRYPDMPEAADLAVTVKDEWQGRGVASALLDVLVNHRRPPGVVRIVTEVANDNDPSLAMLRRLGPTTTEDTGSGASEVEVVLKPLEEIEEVHPEIPEPTVELVAPDGRRVVTLRRPRPEADLRQRERLRNRDLVCPWISEWPSVGRWGSAEPESRRSPVHAAVDPVGSDLKRFLKEAPDEPFVMLNLVRYAEGGRARYTDYLRATAPYVEKAGAKVTYFGAGLPSLVPGSGEGEDWDAVLLVWYPSPTAFTEMIRDPGYQEVSRLRTEALAAAVLQPTRPIGG